MLQYPQAIVAALNKHRCMPSLQLRGPPFEGRYFQFLIDVIAVFIITMHVGMNY
ncbi:hypothetical protein B7P43_G05648 [Cryptotermes secundus]|uniref:Uncharacterized protein n=1 Tax=Cryptotermes secundus TaxID=105785 RepID=A0A2J7RFL3_9NEOP|nr:hypothetical protein B7P43_G05648 [Cryptotermes secundus]